MIRERETETESVPLEVKIGNDTQHKMARIYFMPASDSVALR